MKRILPGIIISILVISAVQAQEKTFSVYKTDGKVQRFAMNSIDHISIDTANLQMMVYRSDGALTAIELTCIDSMNYTTEAYSLPEINLLSATFNHGTSKAVCIAEVTDNGGCEIYEKGICWSKSPEPTIDDNKQIIGSTPGSYYGLMSQLSNGNKYYVRAYAINSMGTAYSDAMEVRAVTGNVTYTLAVDQQQYPEYHQLLKTALDSACYYYNMYTSFTANIYVYYNAGIPTAQASYHGSIGFGPNTSYMWVGTAMHEMAHYFGSGTTNTWKNLMVGGVWQGSNAQSLCQELAGETLKGDNNSNPIHFWPYGINYRSEVHSSTDLVNHAKIVQAMLVEDCGLPTSW